LKIGLLTDALDRLTLSEALDWCAERGFQAVELGVGGYSSTPHASLTLLEDAPGRDRLLALLAERELELAALNVSGNPLHPDPAVGARHDAELRAALQLAHALGVSRVVAMSGCPGAPGGGAWPVFAGGAWLPDMEGLWDTQWTQIAAYWRELSQFAADDAPGVVVCLELHPGTSIYNAESYRQLRTVTVPSTTSSSASTSVGGRSAASARSASRTAPAVRQTPAGTASFAGLATECCGFRPRWL